MEAIFIKKERKNHNFSQQENVGSMLCDGEKSCDGFRTAL